MNECKYPLYFYFFCSSCSSTCRYLDDVNGRQLEFGQAYCQRSVAGNTRTHTHTHTQLQRKRKQRQL